MSYQASNIFYKRIQRGQCLRYIVLEGMRACQCDLPTKQFKRSDFDTGIRWADTEEQSGTAIGDVANEICRDSRHASRVCGQIRAFAPFQHSGASGSHRLETKTFCQFKSGFVDIHKSNVFNAGYLQADGK